MPTVFISYSHDSAEHSNRVLALSDRLRAEGVDATIDQYESSPAEGWPKWMDRQIANSDFIMVVCTETYYRRVMGEEEKGKGQGVKWESTLTFQEIYDADSMNTRFIPVLFDDGKVDFIPKPLKSATYYRLPQQYDDLYRRITNQPKTTKPKLGKLKSLPLRARKTDYLGAKVSLAKLPSTSPDLFGREKELKALDDAWDNSQINVVSLVAWGGVGKSALVNVWLNRMARNDYRGAERVFGWSFYSQGAAEGRQVSADQFIAAALDWFGDSAMANSAASAWDKGERLAELVKQSRTLLILDGLEPLQNPPPVETGRIKDPALAVLLRELARQNPGLVVISTRLAVDDLKDTTVIASREAAKQSLNGELEIASSQKSLLAMIQASTIQLDLDNLSPEAGAAYLAHLGVEGTEQERQDAAKDFGGHALALTLMGSYLKRVYGGDIRKRHEIPRLTDDQKQGVHALRVLESYERWLKGKPELDILRLMGLFDRLADGGAIEALKAKPAIEGLTSNLQHLTSAQWQFAVADLRDLRLLAAPDADNADRLDCHPLLREYFGEQLKQANPAAWRAGNSRLYEYYKSNAKEFPDTIQEMAPLFAAVLHGCQAGKYQETLEELYWKRVQRGIESFNTKKLGAVSAELATLSGFFDPPWYKPVDGLRKDGKGFVLNEASLDLRALGRLAESAQPMQASLDAFIAQNELASAARSASNLSEIYLTIGDVMQALAYANQSVELADRSGDAFMRMYNRTAIGDSLHQSGQLAESQAAFLEAEEMQKNHQSEFPLIYSWQGYRYCDLLLSQGNYLDVQRRASQTLEWAKRERFLLDIALDTLSLGRAYMLRSQREPSHPITESADYLNRAVEGLRQAGTQHHIPRGLLARAELRRVTGALDKAKQDLDEAFTVATRGGMGLYLADCHLEYARLALAEPLPNPPLKGEGKVVAREHLATAKQMIEKMGYHRRDKEVEELERDLTGF